MICSGAASTKDESISGAAAVIEVLHVLPTPPPPSCDQQSGSLCSRRSAFPLSCMRCQLRVYIRWMKTADDDISDAVTPTNGHTFAGHSDTANQTMNS